MITDNEKTLLKLLSDYKIYSDEDDTDVKRCRNSLIAAIGLGARVNNCTEDAIRIIKNNPGLDFDTISKMIFELFQPLEFVDD
jgi:hypothetical protein